MQSHDWFSGCHIIILLKRPCSVPHLFANKKERVSRFSLVTEAWVLGEKIENSRLKLSENQHGLQGTNTTRIHMEARSSISHRNTVQFGFLSP